MTDWHDAAERMDRVGRTLAATSIRADFIADGWQWCDGFEPPEDGQPEAWYRGGLVLVPSDSKPGCYELEIEDSDEGDRFVGVTIAKFSDAGIARLVCALIINNGDGWLSAKTDLISTRAFVNAATAQAWAGRIAEMEIALQAAREAASRDGWVLPMPGGGQ